MKPSTLIELRTSADQVRGVSSWLKRRYRPRHMFTFLPHSKDPSKFMWVKTLSWSIICRLVFVSFPYHLWFGCYNDIAHYTFFLNTLYMIRKIHLIIDRNISRLKFLVLWQVYPSKNQVSYKRFDLYKLRKSRSLEKDLK